MANRPKQSTKVSVTRPALKLALFYIFVAAIWILFSDQALLLIVSDPLMQGTLQTIKGWLFVLVTGGLLFWYTRNVLLRQKLIEEASNERLKDQLREVSKLFDSFNAVVYVADMETYELLYVNNYTSSVFGDNWASLPCYQYLQSDRDAPCDFCTNPQLIKNGPHGPALIWEFQNTQNNRWYECLDKAIEWGDGRLARLEIAVDITERKELEKTKEELISVVSHEMRTPLTAITGFAELLIEDPDVPQHVLNQLQIIFREASKMEDLINTFLDIRRLKTDRARVDYEPIPVATLFERGIKECRDCHADHLIKTSGETGLEVFGNLKELSNVVSRLLNNACHFSPQGAKITLDASLEGTSVDLRVIDNGPGIPANEHEKIFEPFYRLDTGNTRRTRGVGLGLSLAREIVELHGGRIDVESNPGQGSCFHITLPHYHRDGEASPEALASGSGVS